MNTALEYSTRVVQEGGRRCKKSTLNDLVHLTPLRIPLMNPPYVYMGVYVCKSPLLYIGDPVSEHASGATIGMAGRVQYTRDLCRNAGWCLRKGKGGGLETNSSYLSSSNRLFYWACLAFHISENFVHLLSRAGIFKLLRSPGIYSNKSIPPASVQQTNSFSVPSPRRLF